MMSNKQWADFVLGVLKAQQKGSISVNEATQILIDASELAKGPGPPLIWVDSDISFYVSMN
jgi:hypothetical protein